MRWLRFLAPIRAFRDLRAFLLMRRPHEVLIAAISLALTAIAFYGLALEGRVARPYHREITYFQQWSANRSDAEIVAQQRLDAPGEAARRARFERENAEHRAEFQRLSDQMNRIGL